MAKVTKDFEVSTAIYHICGYKDGKVVGNVTIKGKGYWNDRNEYWDDVYADFDIESVTTKVGNSSQDIDITPAYRMCHELRDNLAECIDKAVLAHMEYIFSEYLKDGVNALVDEYTDLTQDNDDLHIDLFDRENEAA